MSGSTTDPSTWRPDESEFALFSERTALEGTLTLGVTYGIVFCLYLMASHSLWRQRVKDLQTWSLLAFINVQFLMGTLYFTALARFTQMTFIDNREIPGGPFEYMLLESGNAINMLGTATFVIGNWFSSAFMLWRCVVFWTDSSIRFWLLFPSATLLSIISLSIAFLVQSSGKGLMTNTPLGIPYYTLAFSLPVVMTATLVMRLLFYRRKAAERGREHTFYTSYWTIFIESAMLYSIFGLVTFIPFDAGNPIQNVFIQHMAQIQLIAPLWIVERIASDKAWNHDTSSILLNASRNRASGVTSTAYESNNSYPMVTRDVVVTYDDDPRVVKKKPSSMESGSYINA